MTVKVLIADNHVLFRAGLRNLINEIFPTPECREVGCFGDVIQAVDDETLFNLVTIDLAIPGLKGFGDLHDLVARCGPAPIVVLSASNNVGQVHRSFDAGIMGYLPKAESPLVISKAIQLVISGAKYIPPLVLKENAAHPDQKMNFKSKLTGKQQSVLACMVKGRSNKEIARELQMSEATVKAHITAIFKCLNVRNRTEAVFYVSQIQEINSLGLSKQLSA